MQVSYMNEEFLLNKISFRAIKPANRKSLKFLDRFKEHIDRGTMPCTFDANLTHQT